MCGVCGCAEHEARIETETHEHQHHDLAPVANDRARLIAVERDILEVNDAQARRNRAHFAAHGVLALNLVSSPGAGKTTLLVETLKAMVAKMPVAVVEGDQQTSIDADRIRETGAKAIQVNTGKGCHLDAAMIDRAFHHLHDDVEGGVLFIENVGNLVCPSGFDLGEAFRIVIASVTEGEDKPLKYPDIFAGADLLIVSKADLAGPCNADVALLIANARRIKPDLPAIVLSARSGEGMERWRAWLEGARAMYRASA
jgi:hydrogenase nickel incorporation protein HypB